jgi:hypothetical protein
MSLSVHEVAPAHRKFSESDARRLSLFAGQAASAVRDARQLKETQHRAQRQQVLYHLSTKLTRMQETHELCEWMALSRPPNASAFDPPACEYG